MDKLEVELKKEYANSIELNLEIVEDKIFDIEDLVDNYINNNKLPDELNVEHYSQIKKGSISHSYIIKIQSDIILNGELLKYSTSLIQIIKISEKLRNKFTVTKDEGKLLMCTTLYPNLMKIETRLRSLVNQIIMQVNGDKWKSEIHNKTKQAGNKRDKQDDLDEIFLETLVSILFEIDVNSNKQIPDNLSDLSKNDLIDIINKIKFKSFWEEAFPNIKLQKEQMDILIKTRNKVMHFKDITFNDFTQATKTCDKVLKLIEKAELSIKGKRIILSKSLLETLSKISDMFYSNYQIYHEFFLKINKQLNPIYNSINSIAQIFENYNFPNFNNEKED